LDNRAKNPALLVVVASLLVACGGATASPGTGQATSAPATSNGAPGTPAAAGAVNVTLQEFAILPDVANVPTGDVTFSITNTGPADEHEFVVIRTDLAAGELPTDENGVVDEEGEGIEVVDEVEAIAVGDTQELTVPLDPGAYALICNIFDEAESEAHYTFGMFTAFEVTE